VDTELDLLIAEHLLTRAPRNYIRAKE
jgi:hypothetical protein